MGRCRQAGDDSIRGVPNHQGRAAQPARVELAGNEQARALVGAHSEHHQELGLEDRRIRFANDAVRRVDTANDSGELVRWNAPRVAGDRDRSHDERRVDRKVGDRQRRRHRRGVGRRIDGAIGGVCDVDDAAGRHVTGGDRVGRRAGQALARIEEVVEIADRGERRAGLVRGAPARVRLRPRLTSAVRPH